MAETMYDRIKSMTQEELRQLIYWVYMCGNEDGYAGHQDCLDGYFGQEFLHDDPNKLMPNGIDDLWSIYDRFYKGEV